MEVNIEIKHVNGMSKPKVTIEDGTISYVLPFEVQLPPGQFDRICNLFRQRVPVQLTISSPQAKMDLFTEVFTDTPTASYTEEDIARLRDRARDALRTSEIAERQAADSGDAGDREVADAAAATAAEAIAKAVAVLNTVGLFEVSESDLLAALGEEVRAEILADGEMQAGSETTVEEPGRCERGCSDGGDGKCHFCGYPMPSDPEALRRQIDGHAAEEEAAVEDPGSGRKGRKTKAAV